MFNRQSVWITYDSYDFIYQSIFNKDYLKPLEFNTELVNKSIKKVDNELKNYIENNIVSEYQLNDEGHNKNHINYVLNRAFEILENYNINNKYYDFSCGWGVRLLSSLKKNQMWDLSHPSAHTHFLL